MTEFPTRRVDKSRAQSVEPLSGQATRLVPAGGKRRR
jgi:hypothetical protein